MPKTPIEETLRTLDDLVKAGKVRAIGCSILSAAQLEEAMTVAQRHGLTSFVTAQDEYSLLERELEKDRLPIMRKHAMGLLPYFPLASGLLTGKYKHNAPLPAGTRLAGTRRATPTNSSMSATGASSMRSTPSSPGAATRCSNWP